MNAAELLNLDNDEPDNNQSGPMRILANVEQMHNIATSEYRNALSLSQSLTDIQYRKGKVQALQEVLEMLATGKIPT